MAITASRDSTDNFNIAECVGEAHSKALTPSNIISGFKKTGIFPFDDKIFTEQDFLSSSVTDRYFNATDETTSTPLNPVNPTTSVDNHLGMSTPRRSEDSTPSISCNSEKSSADNIFISPEVFRGFPKAKPRNIMRKGRKRGKSTIITTTPEKNDLLEKEMLKERKKRIQKRKVTINKELKVRSNSLKKSQAIIESSDSDENDEVLSYRESSTSDLSDIDTFDFNNDAKKDDFVLVTFPQKIHYVGKVISEIDKNQDYEVSFLRKTKKLSGCYFLFPQVPDISCIKKTDIKYVLPPSISVPRNKRLSNYFRFPINFGSLDVR